MNKQYDLIAHLHRQRDWSFKTFGPGPRTEGVLDHIRKELVEVEKHPTDVTEWIDIVLLALDGAWRHGWSPESIAHALELTQTRNEQRDWPDWRTADQGKAIEHVRGAQEHTAVLDAAGVPREGDGQEHGEVLKAAGIK